MKIYALQFDSKWKDKESNFALVYSLLSEQHVLENSLIIRQKCLPLDFVWILDLTTANETEKIECFLSELAQQMKSWVIGGMTHPSQEARKAFNTAVTFNPQGKISIYKKIHPITVLSEDKVHLPGNIVGEFAVNSFTVTPAICYDLRFPELFRSALHFGSDLFVVLGCWPQNRIEHWVTLLRARAIENQQAFVIGVNRIGEDQGLEYGGRTMVITPKEKFFQMVERLKAWSRQKLKVQVRSNGEKNFPRLKEIFEAT